MKVANQTTIRLVSDCVIQARDKHTHRLHDIHYS